MDIISKSPCSQLNGLSIILNDMSSHNPVIAIDMVLFENHVTDMEIID